MVSFTYFISCLQKYNELVCMVVRALLLFYLKGLCISFDEQIERDYNSVYAALSQQLDKAQASIHLAESMFAIAIGGNDIIDRVLLDPAGPLNSTQFIDLMAQSLKRQLQV